MERSAVVLPVILFLIGGACTTKQATYSRVPDDVVTLLFQVTCTNGCSEEQRALWKAHLTLDTHDVNGDSAPELFVSIDHSDWCGAGGRCDDWIFQKGKDAYSLILNDKELRVEEGVTNGYLDLASVTSSGFCEGGGKRLYVTPYTFDGTRYVAKATTVDCVPAR